MTSVQDKPKVGYEGNCRQMLEALMATVHESMVVLDAAMHVVSINEGFARTTGIKAQEAEGQLFEDAIANRWALPGLVEMLGDVAQSGEPIHNLELTHRVRSTEFRTLRVSARRVTPPDGGPLVLVAFEDVTVGRRLDRMRDDLLATVGYDLRTPLAALQGFTRVLIEQKDLSEEKTQEYLRIIHDEAQYLNLLVERFVDNVG